MGCFVDAKIMYFGATKLLPHLDNKDAGFVFKAGPPSWFIAKNLDFYKFLRYKEIKSF